MPPALKSHQLPTARAITSPRLEHDNKIGWKIDDANIQSGNVLLGAKITQSYWPANQVQRQDLAYQQPKNRWVELPMKFDG